jgi:hypothetical protein
VPAKKAAPPRLTDHEEALMYHLGEVVEQCSNVIEAHKKRRLYFPSITLHEQQEIAVLRILLDDLASVQATGRAESS